MLFCCSIHVKKWKICNIASVFGVRRPYATVVIQVNTLCEPRSARGVATGSLRAVGGCAVQHARRTAAAPTAPSSPRAGPPPCAIELSHVAEDPLRRSPRRRCTSGGCPGPPGVAVRRGGQGAPTTHQCDPLECLTGPASVSLAGLGSGIDVRISIVCNSIVDNKKSKIYEAVLTFSASPENSFPRAPMPGHWGQQERAGIPAPFPCRTPCRIGLLAGASRLPPAGLKRHGFAAATLPSSCSTRRHLSRPAL
jgi:hypothetical protein